MTPESNEVTAQAVKIEGEGRTGQYLVLAVTPDRGLCGSVNGSITRATRARGLHHGQVGRQITIVGMGEKTRAGLERLFAKDIKHTIGEHSKLKRRTFKQSAIMADFLLSSVPFDQVSRRGENDEMEWGRMGMRMRESQTCAAACQWLTF